MLKIGQQKIKVAGITTVASNDVAAQEIGALWEKFSKSEIAKQLPDCNPSQVFAVYSDYEGDHTGKYRLTIGHAVPDNSKIPENLSSAVVPIGKYKEFQPKTPTPQDIVAAWRTIWEQDKALHRSYTADCEVYSENGVTIFIGVKSP